MADVSLYEAPVILEGHGRPSVFLAGQVGQKYKDLDSGLEWVCTGERGFIKVDGDDQSEMYNWELVESGGSTGGGVFTVNITADSEENFTADKTFNEIKTAIDSGFICQVKIYDYVLPLVEHYSNSVIFGFVVSFGGGPVFMDLTIKSNNTIKTTMFGLATTPLNP